jgi:YHS domain-containing protein
MFYFCARGCRQEFLSDPARFTAHTAEPATID